MSWQWWLPGIGSTVRGNYGGVGDTFAKAHLLKCLLITITRHNSSTVTGKQLSLTLLKFATIWSTALKLFDSVAFRRILICWENNRSCLLHRKRCSHNNSKLTAVFSKPILKRLLHLITIKKSLGSDHDLCEGIMPKRSCATFVDAVLMSSRNLSGWLNSSLSWPLALRQG